MLVIICLTLFFFKSLRIVGSWSIRYIFGKLANFLSPSSLLHTVDKLFFEVAVLISSK